MQKGYHSLKLIVSEFIVKMIIYPACYYCLFTSCKKVRLRKAIDKEYYSKGYILYLLVAGAKDYKVNVLHHYDKKKIASFQVNGFWFAPLCITLYRIDNTYVGLLLLLVAILQIFELSWILLLTNQKKYIERNTKQHGCGHVQVLYRERIPIIFASNSIQTLWELLHT